MKSLKLLLLFSAILLSANFINAQVGINTTTPAGGSILDVTSPDKGALLPRVNIANLVTIAPVTGGATEGLLVYNTNTTTGPGYFYWDGTRWVSLTAINDDWKLRGNAGTTPGTDFIGTTDNVGLNVRTNNLIRFNFATTGSLHSYGIGSVNAPIYSFNFDTNTGMYQSADDRLNFAAGGLEFLEFLEGTTDQIIFNEDGLDMSLRIESDINGNAIFMDGGLGNIGLGTPSPDPGAQLEMADTDKGLLINRVQLTATNVAAPVNGPENGLLVYNTNVAGAGTTAVSQGFYFWNGTNWVAIDGTNGRDWSLEGNAGTVPGTVTPGENYIGTSDNTDLVVATNATSAFVVSANQRIRASNRGAQTNPFYSFAADPDTGVWSRTGDNLNFSAGAVEFLELSEAGTDVFHVNPDGNDMDFRVESDTQADMLFVDGGTNQVSVNGTPNFATDTFTVIGNADNSAVNAYVTGDLGVGVFGQNIADAGIGVLGVSNNVGGIAVAALQQDEGIALYAQTSADGNATDASYGVYSVIDQATDSGTEDHAPIAGVNVTRIDGSGYTSPIADAANSAIGGVVGVVASRFTNANLDEYLFGVIGEVLQDPSVGGIIPDRTGGVLGSTGTGTWGSAGYTASNGTAFGIYAGADFGNGGGFVGNDSNSVIGAGINGGFMGGYVKGSEYGLVSSGSEFGSYTMGNNITSGAIVQLEKTNGSERVATYASTSTTVDVSTRGKATLNNGSVFVNFDRTFGKLIDADDIHITVTPRGETNGVYVTNVTAKGFTVKENNSGISNASFNWTATATKKAYSNGIELSSTIKDANFDSKMTEVMHNDGDTSKEAKPIYYDGNEVKFIANPNQRQGAKANTITKKSLGRDKTQSNKNK